MTPSPIVDSSALFSLIIETDRNNTKASAIAKKLKKVKTFVIVPGEVFTELVNILGKKINHEVAFTAGKKILNETTFVIVDTSYSIRLRAFAKFQKQAASVSFTDCLVMAFADEYETKEIFGFDQAFAKNGYHRLGLDK